MSFKESDNPADNSATTFTVNTEANELDVRNETGLITTSTCSTTVIHGTGGKNITQIGSNECEDASEISNVIHDTDGQSITQVDSNECEAVGVEITNIIRDTDGQSITQVDIGNECNDVGVETTNVIHNTDGESITQVDSDDCEIVCVEMTDISNRKTIGHLNSSDNARIEQNKNESQKNNSQNTGSNGELKTSSPKKKKSSRKRPIKDTLSEDDEETVFNYMTGLYEKVKKSKTSCASDDGTIEVANEDLISRAPIISKEKTGVKSKVGRSKGKNMDQLLIVTLKPTPVISETIDLTDDYQITNHNLDRNQIVDDSNSTPTQVSTSNNMEQSSEKVNTNSKHCESVAINTISTDMLTKDNGLQNNVSCQICEFQAISRQKLLLHLNQDHLQDEYSIKFTCKICDFESNQEKLMLLHEKNHSEVTDLTDDAITDDASLSKNIDIEVFRKSATSVTEKSKGNKKHSNSNNKGMDTISDFQKFYKCYDCNFKASRKDQLCNHSVRHTDSKFTCTKHTKLRKDCRACIYQSCLLDLETKMLTCSKCGYKTCRAQRFKIHQRNCCGNAASKSIINSDESVDTNNYYCIQQKVYKCFGCNYTTIRKDTMNNHVFQHIDTPFTCPEHSVLRLRRDCDACTYQSCLLFCLNKVQTCDICGYKTIRPEQFAFHQSTHTEQSSSDMENDSNSEGDQGTSKAARPIRYYKCFDCDLKTSRRCNLQNHVVQHEFSTFTCPLHNVLKTDCLQCVYVDCLLNLASKMLICKKCGYKTCCRSRFKEHQDKLNDCSKKSI